MTNFFTEPISNNIIVELLKKNCVKVHNYYVFDTISYRKGEFNNSIVEFVNHCRPFYKSKYQFYLDRKMNSKSFLTILRQICNHNGIVFTNEIKYSNSSYETIYKFWVDDLPTSC